MVFISLRTKLKDLQEAVDKVCKKDSHVVIKNTNWTWIQYLTHLEIPVKDNHVISSTSGKVKSRLDSKISKHIAQFKRNPKKILPIVIETDKYKKVYRVKKARQTTPRHQFFKTKEPRSSKGNVGGIRIIDVSSLAGPSDPLESGEVGLNANPSRNYHMENLPDHDDPANIINTSENIDNEYVNDDNLDSASQISQSSQFTLFSQTCYNDDNDIKRRVMDSLQKNFSSKTLCGIKTERDNLRKDNRWVKICSYIPQMAILINTLFDDEHFQ